MCFYINNAWLITSLFLSPPLVCLFFSPFFNIYWFSLWLQAYQVNKVHGVLLLRRTADKGCRWLIVRHRAALLVLPWSHALTLPCGQTSRMLKHHWWSLKEESASEIHLQCDLGKTQWGDLLLQQFMVDKDRPFFKEKGYEPRMQTERD